MPDRIRIHARPTSGTPRKRRSVPRPPVAIVSNSSVGGGIWGRGEYAFGMACPRTVRAIAVDPRVDPDWTFARLVLCADDDLHCDTTVFADDQRGVQHELVHPRASGTVTRV